MVSSSISMRKVLCIFIFLFFGGSFSLLALSSGNPASPLFSISNNSDDVASYKLYITDSSSNSCKFTTFKFSYDFAFYGDYIFSETAGIKDVPLVNPGVPFDELQRKEINVNTMSVATSGVVGTMNLIDPKKKTFPLWDLSVSFMLGGTRSHYKLPMAGFRVPYLVSAPTDGTIEVQTNYGLAWLLGAKKVLWKDLSTVISTGIDYQQASCPLNYIVLQQAAEPEVFSTTNKAHKIRYKEWTWNIGISSLLYDNFIPYMTLYTGNTSLKASNSGKLFEDLSAEFQELYFKMREIKNTSHLGITTGFSYILSSKVSMNLEGRWGYQRALNLKMELKI